MTLKRTFAYGQKVRVKLPNSRAFTGTVYSEYKDSPKGERYICVLSGGVGAAFLIRYVKELKSNRD